MWQVCSVLILFIDVFTHMLYYIFICACLDCFGNFVLNF